MFRIVAFPFRILDICLKAGFAIIVGIWVFGLILIVLCAVVCTAVAATFWTLYVICGVLRVLYGSENVEDKVLMEGSASQQQGNMKSKLIIFKDPAIKAAKGKNDTPPLASMSAVG